jgi:hypothetical protein
MVTLELTIEQAKLIHSALSDVAVSSAHPILNDLIDVLADEIYFYNELIERAMMLVPGDIGGLPIIDG